MYLVHIASLLSIASAMLTFPPPIKSVNVTVAIATQGGYFIGIFCFSVVQF
jgi:hypothetical protein